MELVDTLPLEPDHSVEYVPITSAEGQIQIDQVRSFLEANGIPSAVRGESIRNVYGFTLNGLAAAEVLVPKEQAAAAMELLEEVEHGDLAIDATESDPR